MVELIFNHVDADVQASDKFDWSSARYQLQARYGWREESLFTLFFMDEIASHLRTTLVERDGNFLWQHLSAFGASGRKNINRTWCSVECIERDYHKCAKRDAIASNERFRLISYLVRWCYYSRIVRHGIISRLQLAWEITGEIWLYIRLYLCLINTRCRCDAFCGCKTAWIDV